MAHPISSPNVVTSDYHLFQSQQNSFNGNGKDNDEQLKCHVLQILKNENKPIQKQKQKQIKVRKHKNSIRKES